MGTEIIDVDPSRPDPGALDRAAAILRDGGLVAFPTETVYGLGARADLPAAMERLRRVKGREAEKPFSLHFPDAAAVERYLGTGVSWRARRLMRRYWPGPLTLVLTDRHGGETGCRVPAGPVPQGFLSACGVPVAAASANPAGSPPACTAPEARAYFDGVIDAVLAGNPTPLKQSSTVIRVRGSRLEVLREGIIQRDVAERVSSCSILILCTGNSCRSPMAEGLFKRLLAERLGVREPELPEAGFRVTSAGIFALEGTASESAIRVLREFGCDISGHRSRQVSPAMLQEAEKVFAVGRAHLERAQELCGGGSDKIQLLSPEGREIQDPMWGTDDVYRRCAEEMEECIRERVREILEELEAG